MRANGETSPSSPWDDVASEVAHGAGLTLAQLDEGQLPAAYGETVLADGRKGGLDLRRRRSRRSRPRPALRASGLDRRSGELTVRIGPR